MKPGDIVWMPFPHVEDNRMQARPALIVATGIAGSLDLCWALMTTAASNPAWPKDVLIVDHGPTGLPVPSRIRTGKIATVPAANATPVGRLPDRLWAEVRGRVTEALRLSAT